MLIPIGEREMRWLEDAARVTGRDVEDLARSAVEEAALDWARRNDLLKNGGVNNG